MKTIWRGRQKVREVYGELLCHQRSEVTKVWESDTSVKIESLVEACFP